MQEQKISTIEGLIDEVTKDIGNYSITQVQNTQEYKFGLACYKVFGKGLAQITKNDVETVWADGRADGGIDLMYITEEDEKDTLNICQAKYGQNIDKDDIIGAFRKMIATFNNLKSKKNYNTYSERLKKIAFHNIDEDYSSVKFVVFLNKDFDNNRTINWVKKEFKEEKEKFNIEIYTKADILDEVDKNQEQPEYVKEYEIKNDDIAKGGFLYMEEEGERHKNGCVINIKASVLHKLYVNYHNNGLFEKNLRYFTKKASVDSPIVKSIQNGGKDFWFHNNGIIIACENFENDGGKRIKLTNFSIINGCQTVSLIGKHWTGSDKPKEEKDFTVLCKIVKPKEEEDFDDFVGKVAHSANNQKPIQGRDLKSNDPVQQKLQSLFETHLKYFYEIKRGEKYNKYQLPSKIMNTELGLITLAFFCQKPGTARNGKSKIFSQETLYKDTFNKVAKFLPQKPEVFGDFLYLWNEVNKVIQSITTIEGDSDGHAKDFLNNGKYFVFAIMGYMFVRAFGASNTMLWNIAKMLKKPLHDKLRVELDDIIRDIANCVGNKYNSLLDNEKEKITSMANFLKTDNRYNRLILSAIDVEFFGSDKKRNSTLERMKVVFDINFNSETPNTD